MRPTLLAILLTLAACATTPPTPYTTEHLAAEGCRFERPTDSEPDLDNIHCEERE